MPQKQSADGRILHFDPQHWETTPTIQSKVQHHLSNNEIRNALVTAFELSPNDSFKYWAHMPVTLSEMQHIVSLGHVNGLHHWYTTDPAAQASKAPNPEAHEKPSRADIEAYILAFFPSSSPLSASRALSAGSKPGSIRHRVAEHLLSTRHLAPTYSSIPKRRHSHWNPGLDFWAWYSRAVAWCGPTELSGLRSVNHPVLPVLMHHFGCVVPTWEALEVMRITTGNGAKQVVEIGSGNGYWAYMLRRHGLKVTAVDSGQSLFRTNWIGDTIEADAIEYLGKNREAANDAVLLMVYPVVSGDFTHKVLNAWEGDEIVVAGTQNGNGYTGFKDVTIAEWMEKERPGWTKVAQIALPSFPSKDEAMFVFKRGQDDDVENGETAEGEAVVAPGSGKNAKANARKKAAKKKAKASQGAAENGQEVDGVVV